jgi:hypothetical protein
VIDGDAAGARAAHGHLSNYPLVLTRDLEVARHWLRRRARGTERTGLVASSNALRLRPVGLHVKAQIDPCDWFLGPPEDVRSSYALEDVATEFDIQGLELDWTGFAGMQISAERMAPGRASGFAAHAGNGLATQPGCPISRILTGSS